MGLRFSLSLLPPIMAGEKVLFVKKWVWALSGKSFPTYRISSSIPLLCEVGLYVTDRRVLFVAYICRLFTQQFSQWFEGKGKPPDNEFVKEVNVGKNLFLLPYLEIVSENSTLRWYRSPRCWLRFFMRNPESVRNIIAEVRSDIKP